MKKKLVEKSVKISNDVHHRLFLYKLEQDEGTLSNVIDKLLKKQGY